MIVRNRKTAVALIIFAILILTFILLPARSETAWADSDMPVYDSLRDVYTLSTPQQLVKLSELVNSHAKTGDDYYSALSYELTADLDMTGISWTPIGTNTPFDLPVNITSDVATQYERDTSLDKSRFYERWSEVYASLHTSSDGISFTVATDTYDSSATYYYLFSTPSAFYGTFNGNGHTVSNLSFSDASATYGGLFGYVQNGTVENVMVEDATIALSPSSVNYVGGICAYGSNAQFLGCGLVGTNSLSGYAYVGGIVGRITQSNVSYTDIDEITLTVTNGVRDRIHNAQDPSVYSCYALSGSLSSVGYTAGILAYGSGNVTVRYCLNNTDITGANTNQGAGIVAGCGSSSNVTVFSCLGLKSYYNVNEELVFGAIKPVESRIYCGGSYYLSDDADDVRTDDEHPDHGATRLTTNGILASSIASDLGGSTYWKASGHSSGTTYYYPVPQTCAEQITFTAYAVTFDDGTSSSVTYYAPNALYTYPAQNALSKTGYSLTEWSDGTVGHDFSSTQQVVSDFTVTPVWALDSPSLTGIGNSIVYTYDGQNHVITPGFSHQASGLTPTYYWKKGANGVFAAASTLTVKEVADSSDSYFCYVSVEDNEGKVAYSETKTFSIVVTAKSVTINVILTGAVGDTDDDQMRALTHVYDGNALAAPSYSATTPCAGQTYNISYSISKRTDLSEWETTDLAHTVDVGEYAVTLSASVLDSSVDVSANYNITVADYSYIVANAEIGYTIDNSMLRFTFDGLDHTLVSSAFNVVTQNGTAYELTIEDVSYRNATTGSVVSYSITADNHAPVFGNVLIVIDPLPLTLSANGYVSFSRQYDGTTTVLPRGTNFYSVVSSEAVFTVEQEENYYSIQKNNVEYATVSMVSAAFSQANVGNNLSATAGFSVFASLNDVTSDDFALTPSTLNYTGWSITPKDVSILPNSSGTLFEKTFDDSTAFSGDLSALLAGKYSVENNEIIVTPVSAVYNDKHVKNATHVTVTFTLDESCTNYTLPAGNSAVTYSARIRPVLYTLTPLPSVSFEKTYNGYSTFDGTITPDHYSVTNANGDAVSFSSITPSGDEYVFTLTSGDSFTMQMVSVAFNSAHVADTTTLNTRINLVHPNDDYALSEETLSFPATIVPREISIIVASLQATDRTYDGTTYVELTGGSLTGVLPIDASKVEFTLHGGTISSPDASETPYDVTVNAITISNGDYILTNPQPTGLTVRITARNSVVHPRIYSATIYDGEGNQSTVYTIYVNDGSLPAISLSDGDTEGTIVWSEYTLDTQGESLPFYWVFIPTDDNNYSIVDGIVYFNVASRYVVSIEITAQPTKTVYTALEQFDSTGLVVFGIQNTGERIPIYPYVNGDSGYYIEYPAQGQTYFHGGDTAVTLRYNEITTSIPITVNRIAVSEPSVGETRTYTGETLSPAVDGFDKNIMEIEGNSATVKGNYTVTISLKNTVDYEWEDGTTSNKSYPWSIRPAGRHVLTLSAFSFVYSGANNVVTVQNDNNFDDGFYTVSAQSVLSSVNVGSFEVTVDLISDNYYWHNPADESDMSDVSSKVLRWSVLPQKVTRPAIYNLPYVYNAQRQNVLCDTSSEYELSGDLTFTAAGNYSVTATLKNVYDGDTVLYGNYVWSDDLAPTAYTMQYEVEKMQIAIPEPSKKTFVYNRSAYSIKISSSLLYTISGDQIKTNVGTYRVSVALADTANTVWSDNTSASKQFVWHITPIYVSVPVVLYQNYYTGYEQTAGISMDEQNNRFILTGNTGKNVGDYSATASLRDKANYCWETGSSADITVAWSIEKTSVKIPDAPENLLYNGFEQTAYIETNDAYVITGNTGKDKGAYTATVTLKNTDGYYWSDRTTAPKTYEWGIYGISAVSEGTEISMSQYELGASLAVPVRSGYTFSGWYTSPDFSESSRVTSIDEVDSNVTIYAKWTQKETVPVNPDDYDDSSETVLSKDTKDKLMAGGIIFGACLVAALLILILGKTKRR